MICVKGFKLPDWVRKLKKLNLGCGTDIREGWVNLDVAGLPGVDVVCDIQKTPLPFADAEFDYILCQDVLEHLDYIPVLQELHRILKQRGVIEIQVPHFSSVNNFIDPTHKQFFSFQTFEFFTKGHDRNYYFNFCFEKLIYSEITFRRRFRFVSSYVNSKYKRKKNYESNFLCRLFPANNLIIRLLK